MCALADGAVAARSSERKTRQIPFPGQLAKNLNEIEPPIKRPFAVRTKIENGMVAFGSKPGKAPSEQKTSALPLIATVAGTFQIGSSVPESDSRRIRGEMLSCVAKLQRNLNLEEYKRSQSRSGG